MRFALVNDERVEAAPKLEGLCLGCLQPVIPKCGTRRIWHWAHRAKRVCDKWWEPETAWHRTWKNQFPKEWQESIQHDAQTGEKHIADVCSEHGIVIEFQYSAINPQEQAAREKFYGNMVWVVDGARLKRDYPRFLQGFKNNFRTTPQKGFFLVHFPDECFPAAWLESTVPVIFDFRGIAPVDPPDALRETLWCLLPGRAEKNAVVVGLSRADFVKTTSSRSQFLPAGEIMGVITQYLQDMRRQAAAQADRAFMQLAYQQRSGWRFRRF